MSKPIDGAGVLAGAEVGISSRGIGHVVSINGHGQWLVDSGAHNFFRQQNNQYTCTHYRRFLGCIRTQNVFASVATPRPSLGLVIITY